MGLLPVLYLAPIFALLLTHTHAKTREYFIAANEVIYNYAPGWPNLNNLDDPKEADTYLRSGPGRIGNVYKKAIYFEYTDATFTSQVPKPARLGILGPLIKAEVGDVILIHFFNNASRVYSIHPHGVFYVKSAEGALYLDNTSGSQKLDDHVPPGAILHVEWLVTESDAPTEDDPPCIPSVYHSHVNSIKDVFAGLFGISVICKPGVLDDYNKRKDVDVELPLLDMNWDENMSWYLDDNINLYCQVPDLCRHLNNISDPDFIDSNLKRSLNGKSFGTLPGLEACVGDRVQFYVVGFGNEMDVHSLHFHGQNLQFQHQRGDTVSVFSATFIGAVTTPTNAGKWRITDLVGEYQKKGTSAFYQVKDCYRKPYPKQRPGYIRQYYLAVEETTWDYVPSGLDLKTGQPLAGPSAQAGPYNNPNSGHSNNPNSGPSNYPNSGPSNYPNSGPSSYSNGPSIGPSSYSNGPSSYPSNGPSGYPSKGPSSYPSNGPSSYPSNGPSSYPNSPSGQSYNTPGSYPNSRVKRGANDRYMTGFLNWWKIHGAGMPDFYHNTSVTTIYKKARFVQYKSQAFRARVPQTRQDEHLGILGPVLKAEIGDRLIVTLKNTIPFPVSFLPHGLSYDVTQEATDGQGVSGGSVQTNQVYTYTFDVPENLLDDTYQPCKSFLYTSAHDPTLDHNTGLVGPLLVCRKGYLDSGEYKPKAFFLLLSIFDENLSLYAPPTPPSGPYASSIMAANMKFSINGYSYGYLPGLSMCVDDDVAWYVMSVGSELDVHTATFDGNTFTERGIRRDVRNLVPGVTATLTMQPDNLGKWMVYSGSAFARENGMFAFYTVSDCGNGYSRKGQGPAGVVRNYYISADEVIWDYAPLTRAIVTGEDLNDPNVDGSIFVRHDDLFIGHIYKKVIYRGYTDSTFRLPIEGPGDILGPALIAEVGDTIRVTFRNNASRPYSIHSHGVQTSQASSGVDYGEAGGVAPGQVVTYIWQIPERSGPGPKDPNCIPWLYSSYVDLLKDKNSGLAGALVVCRPGTLDSYGRRKDVDREKYIYMSVLDENESWYLDENVRLYAPGRVGTDYRNDKDFIESNKKHTINGRLYGNNNNLVMEYGERIVWYMMGLGAQIDLHTIHLHGHTFIHSSQKHRDDVIYVFPGMAEAVEMIADNPGTWLLHCHVMDHIFAGMETVYTVLRPGEKLTSHSSPKGQDYNSQPSGYRR